MVDRLAHPKSGNTILLFGPQALSFDQDAIHALRSTLLGTEAHRWIIDVIADFPQCLDTISKTFPKLVTRRTQKLIEDLNNWFRTEDVSIPTEGFSLPNTLLNPLVIIAQLTQYTTYLSLSNPHVVEGQDIYAFSQQNKEALGFCTGLLSALAISSSNNKAQFQKHGAVALRVGMLIGMVVDAQEASPMIGESKSLAVVWNSPKGSEEVKEILKTFPEVSSLPSYRETKFLD
jgi:hypothetical protein